MNFQIEHWLKNIFHYSLLLIAFFIPAHTRFTGVFVIAAIVSWLFLNRFKISFSDKRRFLAFLFFSALYFCYALGMLYTSNQSFGWQLMQLRSSMVILPLLFLSDQRVAPPSLKEIITWFIAGGIALSLVVLIHASYVFIAEHKNIFAYGYLLEFLDLNSAYVSLYFVLMILAIALQMIGRKGRDGRIIPGGLILFFVGMVALLSSRGQVIALAAAAATMFMIHFGWRKKIATGIISAIIMLASLFLVIMLFPETQDRFIQMKNELNEPYVNEHPTSVTVRKAVWEISAKLILMHPVSGVGTGDTFDSLLHHYQLENLVWPFNDRLNAHNQFLQTSVSIGIAGLAALLLLFFTGFRIAITTRSELYFLFLLIFIISNLTESMLETEAGVIFFSFFNSVLANRSLRIADEEKKLL